METNIFDATSRLEFNSKNIECVNQMKLSLCDNDWKLFSKCSNVAILLNNKLVALNQFYREKGKNFYKDTLFLPSIILAYLCDLFDEALKKFQTLISKKENNDLFDEEVYYEYEMFCRKIFMFQISENSIEAFETFILKAEGTYSIDEIERIIEYLNEELTDLGFEQMEFVNFLNKK